MDWGFFTNPNNDQLAKEYGETWRYSPYMWPNFPMEYAGFTEYDPSGIDQWRGKRGSWFKYRRAYFPELIGRRNYGPELASKDAHIHAWLRHRKKLRKRKR
jgi:hypothetical protein